MRKLALVVAVFALVASACDLSGGEDAATPAPGTSPEPGQQAMESREDKLPDGFPTDFPLPTGHRVIYSQWNEQGSLVYFDATQTPAELVAFFESDLPGDGWTIRECTRAASPGPATLLIAQKGTVLTTTVIGRLPNPNVDVGDDYEFFVTVLTTSAQVEGETDARCPQ